jgi:hypothetical protein
MYRSNRRVGLPAPALTSPFLTDLTVFRPIPAPVLLLVRVHPPVSFTSPTEHFSIVTRPRHQRKLPTRAPSLGFSPSSRHKCVESTNSELPTAHLTFRPQRFSRSRRFTPPHTSWACFIPQPRPGFTLQGFSPPPSQRTSSIRRSLMRLPRFSCRRASSPVPDPHDSSPGL